MDYNESIHVEKLLQTIIHKLNSLKERLIRIKGTDISMEYRLQEEITEMEEEKNKIEQNLANTYNFHYNEGATQLRKKIEELSIDEDLGILHLVNCNRENMRDCFWKAFDEKEEEDFQFYFISACGTQMPPSFSERMIYELIYEELEENDKAIHLNRRPNTGRVQFFDLPIGRKLERCQQEFKKFFSRYFRFKETESFNNFIKIGLPKMDYEYVVLVFEISEVKWKDYFIDYFQWLINTFSNTPDEVPKFLFFFVIYINDLHLEDTILDSKREIVQAINNLCIHNNTATSLSPLPPVHLRDVQEWFRGLGQRNPTRVYEIIEVMRKGLQPEQQELFKDKKLLNMDNIERVQELVYQVANQIKR